MFVQSAPDSQLTFTACREHYGEFHSETIIISKGLSVVLQRGSTYEDQLAFVCRMFDEAERTMEIYDSRRLMITACRDSFFGFEAQC